jgi:hypothetical protein
VITVLEGNADEFLYDLHPDPIITEMHGIEKIVLFAKPFVVEPIFIPATHS